MNWRKAVAVCTGVLLPLPLVLVLWGLLRPDLRVEAPPGVRISPVLDNEQRLRLMTYGRHCGPGKDCEPPLGCLFDVRYVRTYCTDSECETDAQCPEGQFCRNVATWGGGPQVRFCVPLGVRQEGEGCIELPSDRKHACAAGLLCGGEGRSWCARPCRPGDSKDCPEGFFCADTVPEPVCLPTCETRGCPTGQQCIPFDEGASTCAQIYGPNCRQTPCPDARRCRVDYEPPRPDEVWMNCVERCGEEFPPCGSGKVCDGYECLTACDPQGPQVCEEGYYCSRRRDDEPFSCQPTYWLELLSAP